MPFLCSKYFIVFSLVFIINASLALGQTGPADSIVSDTSSLVKVTAGKEQVVKKSPTTDTAKVKLHSPKKAAWMSAALPGLGQIYNKKYWKVPVIYVGFGIIGYLGYNYYTKFNKYKDTYMYRSALDTTVTDYFPEIMSKDILYENWNYYRRNFELTCIVGSLFYILNIIDASVDGHLYKFDISDDLSLKVEPDMNSLSYYSGKNMAGGIKISLKF
ncbi:MAG TPA: DUF5683 domain-containing protein [Bacteroidales bacterium]|jgi:hypothetical protein|nr:hypothetical protein [Bacteroidales bacterium]HNZ42475.1 DUF5683 domain-containing protein [Bacteroidales bacterium]HPB25603.1 DUF5683 domain-containing protein [Bacteroidales bacterium]HPI29795.1 DUF5683 domain-containing protein [Bacteroidales bacterium]HQN16279.1 DUF5683 domain-containing protein [Bacteroidales bacterium]